MSRKILTGGDGTTGQTGLEVINDINSMTDELYTSKHDRQHALNSSSDHSPVSGSDKGKILGTNPSTGVPELRFLGDSDIPVIIARQAALQAHLDDKDNPHDVTAEQLGITGSGLPSAGAGLQYTDVVLNAVARDLFGLGYDPELHDSFISFANLSGYSSLKNTDYILFGNFDEENGTNPVKVNLSELASWIASNQAAPAIRETIYNSGGVVVEVLQTKTGTTCSFSSGNILSVHPIEGTHIFSMKVRFTGYATLIVNMDTTDMANSSQLDRWMPIVQAWREDTYAQLTGLTTQMSSSVLDQFTISGLINNQYNHIRLSF